MVEPDYTPGTYTNISLTGGSGTGATATFTVSSAGLVSGIQIQDSGTGYERGDYLSVDDADLVRSGASQSTARFTIYIGHVGFAAESTSLTVDDPLNYAVNDLITIGEEVLKIVAINGSTFTVDRAQKDLLLLITLMVKKLFLKMVDIILLKIERFSLQTILELLYLMILLPKRLLFLMIILPPS